MADTLVTTDEATEFFNSIDTSGDGVISAQELRAKMSHLNNKQVAEVFTDLDDDGDKKISLQEFLDDVCKPARRKGLEEAFKNADKDGSNTLSRDEISQACNGCVKDKAKLDEILNNIDTDGSGQIDKEEFIAWMTDNL